MNAHCSTCGKVIVITQKTYRYSFSGWDAERAISQPSRLKPCTTEEPA